MKYGSNKFSNIKLIISVLIMIIYSINIKYRYNYF